MPFGAQHRDFIEEGLVLAAELPVELVTCEEFHSETPPVAVAEAENRRSKSGSAPLSLRITTNPVPAIRATKGDFAATREATPSLRLFITLP
jgi:hypothetical protein